MGFFDKFKISRLREGLIKTHDEFVRKINRVFYQAREIDDTLLGEIEETLLLSDVGVQTTEQIMERTNRDIDAARDAAVRQVREEAVNLATMMAEKVLRRNLNPDDQRRILGDSLEQMQTIAK